MATETAVINIGFTRATSAKKAGAASAQLQSGAMIAVKGYAGGSGLLSSAVAKTKLPQAQLPLGRIQADGTVVIDPTWYRFLDYIANVQLGGITGPTMGDLTTTIDSTRASAISAQTQAAAVVQTVNANATSLAATVQVAQTNNLGGASQIPPVTYTKGGLVP